MLTAVTICRMMDRNADKKLSELKDALPKTYGSPTMSPFCPDDKKYGIVDALIKKIEELHAKGEKIIGSKIESVVTVNGVRFTLDDGTWGLIRASSNKPSLVVVVESPVSEDRLHDMFEYIESVLASYKEVGEYDQKISRKKAA